VDGWGEEIKLGLGTAPVPRGENEGKDRPKKCQKKRNVASKLKIGKSGLGKIRHWGGNNCRISVRDERGARERRGRARPPTRTATRDGDGTAIKGGRTGWKILATTSSEKGKSPTSATVPPADYKKKGTVP